MENGLNGGTPNSDFRKFITSLDLSNNKFLLRDANDGATDTCLDGLEHMSKLRSLALSNSGLRSLPLSVGKISSLRWLKVSRNELRSFRDKIRECHNLQCIVARRNRLTSEGVGAADLCKLASLSVLDLSHNNLLFIPKDFETISSLTVLNLAHNSIRIIPKGLFASLRNLLHLDLSENCLETIPETLQKLKKLKRLSLNDNNTLSCERLGSVVYLRSLQSLSLSNTDRCLGGLPDLRHLVYLSELDISKNSLSTLPAHVYGMTRLKRLNLSDNCLISLSSSELGKQKGWQLLQTLNLSRNRLTSLPSSFSTALKSCRHLYLNGNALTFEGLPAGLDKLVELQVLSLMGNQLQTLPESLGRCFKLRRLIISQNPILAYPQSFAAIRKKAHVICSEEEIFSFQAQDKVDSGHELNSNPTNGGNGYAQQVNLAGKFNQDNVFPDNVGTTEGLFCWFIDSFTPKPLPIPTTLYSGECYILLKSTRTLESAGAMRHDIHLWIGKDAPVDKQGSVAVYAIQLRRAITRGEKTAGKCSTFRHDQGCESDAFMQLFEHKRKVQWGCLTESALYTVSEQNDDNGQCECSKCNGHVCRHMYMINQMDAHKGKIWAVQVPLSTDYLQRHASIMVRIKIKNCRRSPLIVWFGREVSSAKRAKIRLFVEQFWKQELSESVSEILDYQEGEENGKFWLLVFGQAKPDIVWSSRRSSLVSLDQVVCYVVKIKKDEVCIEQDRLTRSSCLAHNLVYVVDCWMDLFVWIGRRSDRLERAAAVKIATELKTLFSRPDDAAISIQMDGRETFFFRQMISPQCAVNLKSIRNKTVVPPAQLHGKVAPRLEINELFNVKQFSTPSNGDIDDDKEVTAFELNSQRQPRLLEKNEFGTFFSNTCYVYIVVSPSSQLVYFWQGRDIKTNKSWFLFNVHIKRRLHSVFGDGVQIIKIHQLQEPLEFVSLFKRSMIIYRPDRLEEDVRCFQMSLHAAVWTRTVELERIEELCPLCVYIVYVRLSTQSGVVYVWQSDLMADRDAFMAEKLAGRMFSDPKFPVQRINQGMEPDNFFWQGLGGVKNVLSVPSRQVRLFHCSSMNGYFEVHESPFPDKCQDCLKDGDVSILDDGNGTLFVWLGPSASQNTIVKAIRVAQVYAGRVTDEKKTLSERECSVDHIRFISKHKEPLEFRRCFFNWCQHKQPPVNLEKRSF